ncbi:hypothetical protein [Chryseobacterium bernardetii]|uniref:hypothetical protein n=1 Tax=Chryseobacterium bernardetii TaxID=1241978 RepID=UPI003AF48CFF
MIDFVIKKGDFKKYRKRYLDLFHEDREFEDNIFKEQFKNYLAFDFDFIYEEIFFNSFKSFLKEIKEQNIIFYTINPSPDEYFFNHFNKYIIFDMKVESTYTELYNIMYKDPGEDTGNYLGVVSDDIAWFSESADWTIAGSRELEIAIVGFSSLEMKEKFILCFTDTEILCTIKEYVEILDNMLNFNEKQWVYYDKIINNYYTLPHKSFRG